ncbi:TetR/AcrR family transcriptional regulator [Luteococcus peritonei]|uniref:TetR/AcrR family transcriptional regulator n=1 Tax=Luteococcus peritonei TaxID=88874 RepID=A0ABW4RWH4_9ACTN
MEFTDDAEGLRERKKRETRRALNRAAIELVLEHGLGGVTAEDIARRAGVSPRTFFNYFQTKEAALTGLAERVGDRVDAALSARPQDEPLWTTVRWLAVRLAQLSLDDRDLWQARRRLMDQQPQVVPILLGGQRSFEAAVTAAVADRATSIGEDSPAWRPGMMALVALDAVRVASQQATGPDDVVPLLEQVLDSLAPGLAGQDSAPTT